MQTIPNATQAIIPHHEVIKVNEEPTIFSRDETKTFESFLWSLKEQEEGTVTLSTELVKTLVEQRCQVTDKWKDLESYRQKKIKLLDLNYRTTNRKLPTELLIQEERQFKLKYKFFDVVIKVEVYYYVVRIVTMRYR